MTMHKTQSQINADGTKDPNEKPRVWVTCRAKSAMGFAGEGGCGGQEAYILSRNQTASGVHTVVYQCVRCGRAFNTTY